MAREEERSSPESLLQTHHQFKRQNILESCRLQTSRYPAVLSPQQTAALHCAIILHEAFTEEQKLNRVIPVDLKEDS